MSRSRWTTFAACSEITGPHGRRARGSSTSHRRCRPGGAKAGNRRISGYFSPAILRGPGRCSRVRRPPDGVLRRRNCPGSSRSITEYPCGVLPYERDTRAGRFKQPKKQVVDARYIGAFVSVDQDHEHFCDGWPSSILSGGAGRMEEFLPVRFDAVWEPARGRADAASLRLTDFAGVTGRVQYSPSFGGSGEAYLGKTPDPEWWSDEPRELGQRPQEVAALTAWFQEFAGVGPEATAGVLESIVVGEGDRRWGVPITAQLGTLLEIGGVQTSNLVPIGRRQVVPTGRYPLGRPEWATTKVGALSGLRDAIRRLPAEWAPYIFVTAACQQDARPDEGGRTPESLRCYDAVDDVLDTQAEDGEFLIGSLVLSPWLSEIAGAQMGAARVGLAGPLTVVWGVDEGPTVEVSLEFSGAVGDLVDGQRVHHYGGYAAIRGCLLEGLSGA